LGTETNVPRLAQAWFQLSSYMVAVTRAYLHQMQPNCKRVVQELGRRQAR